MIGEKLTMQQVALSPKVASTVSVATTASGVGTLFEWFPLTLAEISMSIGAILSLVLIVIHIIKCVREGQEHKLRMKKLRKEMDDK